MPPSRRGATGDLDDYQRFLLDEARRKREIVRDSPKAARPVPRRDEQSAREARNPGKLKALQREQGQLEKTLLDLQSEQHSLEARLSTPLPSPELAESGRRLNQITSELSALEDRWLRLSEEIDAAIRLLA